MADRNLEEPDVAGERRHLPLVLRIVVAVHEHDGDGLDAVGVGTFEVGAHRREIGRRLDGAVGAHALGHLDHAFEQHVGLDDVAGEDLRPRLVTDLEGIAEALGGDEQRAPAFALQQRVGGDRGAHLDGADHAGRDRLVGRKADEVADALHGGVAVGLGIFRQQLVGCERAVRPTRDDVREGAAAVDPEFPAR